MKSIPARAAIAALCALSLSGCIDSAAPILTDAEPLLGERLNLQLYGMRNGFAAEPQRVTYRWTGTHYARIRGDRSMNDFTVHPFEGGDLIVQTVPSNKTRKVEYAVLHPLMDGIYYVVVIDEADADQATRDANCAKPSDFSCRVTTREQIFALARATAARHKDNGGLAIRLRDDEPPGRASRRTVAPR